MGAKQSVRLRAALVFSGTLAICATGSTNALAEYAQRPSPEQTVLARSTCSNVMGIKQGYVPFDTCVESLSQILMEKDSALMVSQESDATSAISRPGQVSYSESNFQERRRKEEYSCAQLGMPPDSSRFSQCVGKLDTALRSEEYSN